MLISEQVEEAVNEEQIQFLLKGVPGFLRLPLRSLDGNDNISEHRVFGVGEFSLALGKGEHIGGPVFFSPDPVQFPDLAVIEEQEA